MSELRAESLLSVQGALSAEYERGRRAGYAAAVDNFRRVVEAKLGTPVANALSKTVLQLSGPT